MQLINGARWKNVRQEPQQQRRRKLWVSAKTTVQTTLQTTVQTRMRVTVLNLLRIDSGGRDVTAFAFTIISCLLSRHKILHKSIINDESKQANVCQQQQQQQ